MAAVTRQSTTTLQADASPNTSREGSIVETEFSSTVGAEEDMERRATVASTDSSASMTTYSSKPAPSRLATLKKLSRSATKMTEVGLPEGKSNSLKHSPSTSVVSLAASSVASMDNNIETTSSMTAGASSSHLFGVQPGQTQSLYDSHILPLMPKKSEARSTDEAGLPNLYTRRIAMMDDVIKRLQDPRTGIELKDRKKMFKMYPRSFLGCDLLDWIQLNCSFLTRDEAMKFCQTLFNEGYIIPVDLGDKFVPDSSIYIFQTHFYWPSRVWVPSDFDYTVYLLKRNMRATAKYLLHEWEEDRLIRLQDTFYDQWEEIEETVESHILHMKRVLTKQERRTFQLQEFTFWKVHRPLLIPGAPTFKDGELKQKDTKNAQRTEAAYEETLKDEELLAWLERKVEFYNMSLSMNRLKISQASKTLIQRCDVWRALDPILEPPVTHSNPWLSDDSSILTLGNSSVLWNAKKHPSSAEIKMWTYSFPELMRDPMGVRHFYDFVQKEFSQENLEFYLKCQALDSVPTRKEFTERAKTIYDEFIKINAPRELNINSSERSAIIAQFDALQNNPKERLSYYVFADALKHIFALMAKDSYVRFCGSDVVSKALSKALEREKDGGMVESKTGSVGKRGATRSSRDTLQG
ncbi:uncharacterized protein SPPG_07577 [Spizellomyces punctatus DAOM BR117]|uniref:RGS domain-containing protein n=1 Tax=Spizellomyces punctatus (strain DAOM BR117) TaxID=645134 RepID=A0A0L0H8E0_SPIPD|nr:uncharacterized protein SPPG_07577 [Spizellomyces punctatus DAOM BR117]KNC97189.1 hypothetical protein SPPG_07577 [Spizellomyces punctatus DAOM BR117]|eukprot:XP_016605229.1 hypothetical protein SPPG_07577 [Spizellomyces punctatus DAOM BR117]